MSIKTQKLGLINSNRELIKIRITPDAKFAVICEYGKWFDAVEVYIKNLLKDEPIETIPHVNNNIQWIDGLAYITDISPNGRLVAITYNQSSPDGHDGMEAFIWDRKQEKFLDPFIRHDKTHHKSFVAGGIDARRGYDYLDIRFLPDNERVITVSISGEILVWSLSQQKLLWAVSAAAHIADSVAFSHKFGLFAMSDYLDDYRIGIIGQYTTRMKEILYQQYGKWIASENLEIGPSFRLWNTYSGTLIREFDVNEQVNQLIFSPNDKLIAGEMNDTCFIWEIETGEVVDALPKNTKPIAFSSDNQFLITQLGASQIGLWHLQTKQWHYLYELEGKLRSAQVSTSDKIIAMTASNNEWLLHEIQLELT